MTWHYQWVIINEFLPGLVGRAQVTALLTDGPRHYRPQGEPFIPVEFADAPYRYGHSQIRQLYRTAANGPLRRVFPDLIGFSTIGDRRVDWSLLFDVPGRAPAQRAKPIDGQLPRSLIELPQAITGAVEDEVYRSLAARDLERGEGTGLPSGESVARFIGASSLTEGELDLRRHGWEGDTPLWLYMLRESAAREDASVWARSAGVSSGRSESKSSCVTPSPTWRSIRAGSQRSRDTTAAFGCATYWSRHE